MNSNQKGLWTVLIIILIILVIWGIVAAYNRSEVNPADQGTASTSGEVMVDHTGASANSSGGSANNGGSGITNSNAPTITSVTPASGRGGVQVGLGGTGFTASNNTISFSGLVITSTGRSTDGLHLNFTIPDSYRVCTGSQCSDTVVIVGAGSYPIVVTNANGTSNPIYFQVTSTANGQ